MGIEHKVGDLVRHKNATAALTGVVKQVSGDRVYIVYPSDANNNRKTRSYSIHQVRAADHWLVKRMEEVDQLGNYDRLKDYLMQLALLRDEILTPKMMNNLEVLWG